MIKNILFILYKFENLTIRRFIKNMVMKIEKGEMYSITLRRIFNVYHNVNIGMYTYGGCFDYGCVGPFVTIGRYCSFARNVHIFTRNHPVDTFSTHPFFFNSKLGYCEEDLAKYLPLQIGSDTWFGYGSIVIPRVQKIEHGAIVAAGAVVTESVPPYAVVAGNPATIVKYRHSGAHISELLNIRWWERSIDENLVIFEKFRKKFEEKKAE
ncbi:MAG TPA: CatB-related O-acetyltransferase [Chitinispirillaceae bacterium]|nr:CatB-related O-acetyltransferase [Chitinispirillaceae bacterium]